jgi:AsmA protein
VTPTNGLKRLGIGIAAFGALVIGLFAAVPLFVRADAVRDAVRAEIRDATGFNPILRGKASLSSFPSSSASFTDIALDDGVGTEPALAAERLTARLRFLPLLIGRIEVAEITLIRPQLLVDIDAEGRSNWSALLSTLSRTLTPGSAAGQGMMSFSEIRLVDGSIVIRDRTSGTAETLDAVELSLAWPAISKTFGATGHFVWRGERVDASLTLADFVAALSGDRSGLRLRLTAAPLKLAFDGHVGHKPTLKLEGTLAADGASLRQVAQWTTRMPLPGSGFGRFALKAQTSVIGSTVALSGVNMELDGNAAEGVLTLAGDRRRVLQGTLAAGELDITPYVSDIRLRGIDERDWSRAPLLLEGFSSFDFDLRLSASRIALAGSKFGRTAVGASLRSGRLTLTIGEAQAFGGTLKGSIGLARAAEAGADLKAQVQFTDVDLEACLNAVFGVRRLEGRGNIALALEASGKDVESLTRALNGSASLVAARGALNGINVEQLLRRLERRPLSGTGDFRTGRTPFDKLAVNVRIADGTATVDALKFEGSAVRLALGGSASIPSRALDLQGVASLAGASREAAAGFELPFVVRGRWDDPVMLPDVQSLIRRSGAAQPLLEAVRGGRSREAVRNAIEQLTRGAEPPQAIAPAPPVQ